jgi:hypothetical protein
MIVLATAGALTGGLTADAFARGGGGGGGGGHVGGGAHMGGFGGGSHMGGGVSIHEGRSAAFHGHRVDGLGFFGCSYSYPNHNPYSCPAY